MKKILVMASVVTVAVMLVFSFSGCASIAQKAVEKAIENAANKEGESVDVNLEKGEVNIQDKEGNEINIGSTKIPDNWPSSVTVNDNIKIQLSGSSKSDNKNTWTISGTFNGKAEDLYNWYKDKLSGWTVDYDSVTNSDQGNSYTAGFSNDQYTVTLIITDSKDAGVSVVLGVAEK